MNGNIAEMIKKALGSKYNKEALHYLRVAAKALEEEIEADAENAAINERFAKMGTAGVDPRLLHYQP